MMKNNSFPRKDMEYRDCELWHCFISCLIMITITITITITIMIMIMIMIMIIIIAGAIL